jgi:hypothetical protein
VTPTGRPALLAGAVLLAGTVLGGCGDGSPSATEVSPPTPVARTASFCERLARALPARVDGRRPTRVTPSSPLTAGWGAPPVVLRCGVPPPRGLTRSSRLIEVDGLSWFLRETDDAFVFTTADRVANVEVRVPSSVPREEATAPLVDLARPVLESLPSRAEFSEGP